MAAPALPPGIVVLPAADSDRAELEALLVAAELPLDGLDSCFPHDVVLARLDGAVVGAAGLERWGAFGLLRSVVVAEAHRGKHIAEVLIADRLRVARLGALQAVYLLTSDAGPYFERFGFSPVDRATLPAALAGSAQISGPSCPTARAMVKQLADSSSTDALLDEHIAKELAAAGTLVPPWTKFPEMPRRSIGWRMGAGEWYLWMWQRWWQRVAPAERAAYVARWSADVPAAWLGWLPAPDSPAG